MAPESYKAFLDDYPIFDHSVYLVEAFNLWRESKSLDSQRISIHLELVKQVSMNMFVDLDRIKQFHEMKEVNAQKFAAYQAAWILRIRPIQLHGQVKDRRKHYVLANELFTLHTMLAHMYVTSKELFRNEHQLAEWTTFLKRLVYHFHHRVSDGPTLELAFEALGLAAPYDLRTPPESEPPSH